MDALRALFATFDIDTAQAAVSLKNLDKSLEDVKTKLGGLVDAFVGSKLVTGFKDFVAHQIEMGAKLDDTAQRLGIGTEELQRFQFAAKLAGVEGEEAARSLGFLNKNVGEAIDGNEEAVKTFAKLGISIKDGNGNVRQLSDILPDVADAFGQMGSTQEQAATAMKLFGKAGAQLIPLLKGGSEEIRKVQADFDALGGGMSKEFVSAAAKADDELDKMKFGLSNFGHLVAMQAIPYVFSFAQKMQGMASVLIKFTRETNFAKEAVVLLGVGVAASAAKGAAGLARLLGIVPKGASFWETVLGIGKWVFWVALIAGAALLFEDLYTMIQGGDSVLGDFLQTALGVEDFNALVTNLRDSWDQVSVALSQLKPAFGDLAQLLKDIVLSPYFIASVEYVVRLLGSVISLLAGGTVALAKVVKGDFTGAGKAIDRAGDSVFGKNGFFGENALKPYAQPGASTEPPQDFIGPPALRSPTGFSRGPTVVNQTNQVTNNISGVKDAQGAGQAAKSGTRDALDSSLQDTMGAVGQGG